MAVESGSTSPGLLLVLSAPLGVGKRTLCQALLDRHPEMRLSVSKTTRPRGPREVEGYDFYFINEAEFKKQAAAGEFLEHVEIHGHFFGTPRSAIEENRSSGRDVILDVNTAGARRVKAECPEALLVFVSPSTPESLEARLKNMDPGRPDLLPGRLARAKEDISHASEYDYVILSDNLVETAEELSAILRAEHRRTHRVSARVRENFKLV